jgi:nucleotide-binding universal stress UspA family protein
LEILIGLTCINKLLANIANLKKLYFSNLAKSNMSYATLMTSVDSESPIENIVRMAAALAVRFSATLIGVSAQAVRPPVFSEGILISDVSPDEIKAVLERLSKQEKWFRKAATKCGSLQWRSAIDFPTDMLTQEARAADLVIINGRRKPGDEYNSLNPAGVILKSGRPVLVVPEGVESIAADHVVVGWKDTREARRAIQDALPFLHEASRVTVVQVYREGDEERSRRATEDVVRFLSQHRIRSEAKTMLHKNSDAMQLVEFCLNERADLLVTGAYGHSRLGEWIFGGVTHELLTSSPVCCLMSH